MAVLPAPPRGAGRSPTDRTLPHRGMSDAPLPPRLQAAFEQAGVTGFNMDGKTGPTMDSHRLIWWGKKIGKQDAIVEELFKAYFL